MNTEIAARLEHIQSLAEVAKTALPLGMNAISISADGIPVIARPPQPARLKFAIEGLLWHVAVSPEEDGDCICQVWTEVGHVPYTAQAPDKRRDIMAILRGTQGLTRARFVVGESQKILVLSETRVEGHVTADALVYEVVMLLQEARPFLRLFSHYL
ncbi:MAG TPA: hypothetical protein VEB64_02030 [Azospirillaceae bacterium]|nr:hypothetical protein [Azospirillaceae bacterium]